MRPPFLYPLFASPSSVRGVGDKYAALLENLGIGKIIDLLWHLPYAVNDRRPGGFRLCSQKRRNQHRSDPGNRTYCSQKPQAALSGFVRRRGGKRTDARFFQSLSRFYPQKPAGRMRTSGQRQNRTVQRPLADEPIRIISSPRKTAGRFRKSNPSTV